MRTRIAFAAALAFLPAAAVAQKEAPPRPSFQIVNDTPARVYYRVKMWQDDFSFVMAGRDVKVEIPDKIGNLRSVQVEARSRGQWDNCFATVQVGAKLIVTQGKERISCKVER
jgi:hypothetical protein